MYLFLFLLLLRVCELDDDGGGAGLHGLRVVHRLDRRDRSLPRRERHESTACKEDGTGLIILYRAIQSTLWGGVHSSREVFFSFLLEVL